MIRIFSLAVLLFVVMLSVTSCKMDEQQLNDQLVTSMQADELLYFSETILGAANNADLNKYARDAARHGYTAILTWLKAKGADLNRADNEGYSPLLAAAENGQLATLRYLVEKVGVDVRSRTKTRQTALMMACLNGKSDVCRYLLDRGANLNARSVQGGTALMYAAASGNLELVQFLIENGADKQARDGMQRSALVYAKNDAVKNYLKNAGVQEP